MRTWGVALAATACLAACTAETDMGNGDTPVPIGMSPAPIAPMDVTGGAGEAAPAPTIGEAVTADMKPMPPPDMATSETPVSFPDQLPPPSDDPSSWMDPSMNPLPPVPPGAQVPDGAHCAPVKTWDTTWVQYEEEVLRLTNQARAVGHNCDSKGNFGPAPPLTMEAHLRCSARLHSMDMSLMGYFDHTSKSGLSPFDRMGQAGYAGSAMGENIAMGQRSPAEVVQGWLDSDGHCSNIMSPMFAQLGVGYYAGASTGWQQSLLWTQNFGSPRGW